MIFHFSIGPVQSFVAQARRTRDFWAGSFLLSWLSAVAVVAVEKQGGKIQFPEIDSNFKQWLQGHGSAGTEPRQATIPNKFSATVDDEFKPDQVVDAVQSAWKALAGLVWDGDLAHLDDAETQKIWDRQIESFFSVRWILAPADNFSPDRRGTLKDFGSMNEPGHKCVLIEGLQELSGCDSRHGRNKFWHDLAAKISGLDIVDNEPLSAIAFVKRRFVRHYEKLTTPMPGDWTLTGWKLDPGVPSTSLLATVHWLERILTSARANEIPQFNPPASYKQDRKAAKHFVAIRNAVSGSQTGQSLLATDPRAFLEDEIDDDKLRGFCSSIRDIAKNDPTIGTPNPYYAILAMDGDRLGDAMRDPNKHAGIAAALAAFTKKVPETVDKSNGFLIYAGGDDVLALLTLEDAVGCAVELRNNYIGAMKARDIDSTLSGAIILAHMKSPLTDVLHKAHVLLDDIAKDRCGRDALAVEVWKPGGRHLQWVQPWEKILAPKGRSPETLNKVREDFSKFKLYSSGFMYHVRDRFATILADNAINEDQKKKFLVADLRMSEEGQKMSLADSQALVDQIIDLGRTFKRDVPRGPAIPQSTIVADGALLARFLTVKGG